MNFAEMFAEIAKHVECGHGYELQTARRVASFIDTVAMASSYGGPCAGDFQNEASYLFPDGSVLGISVDWSLRLTVEVRK